MRAAEATIAFPSTPTRRRRGGYRGSRITATPRGPWSCRPLRRQTNIQPRSICGGRLELEGGMSSTLRGAQRDQESVSIAGVIAGYRPVPGLYDEMMDEAGQVRPHWLPLLEHFAALRPADVSARFR